MPRSRKSQRAKRRKGIGLRNMCGQRDFTPYNADVLMRGKPWRFKFEGPRYR